MSDEATLDSYEALVSSFTEFLTVVVHTILYERNIYPRTSFLNARKYNYPVRQSRHPQVCKWIQDAIEAVEIELLKVGLSCSCFCLYAQRTLYPVGQVIPVSISKSFKRVARGEGFASCGKE